MAISISELFPNLADINFCSKDPDAITEDVISRFELLTGRSLARADPVRLFLNAIILYFVQQRNAIDFAAKMNLLAFAQGSFLDHLGSLYGVQRLSASSAACTVRFSLSASIGFDAVIPAGTRVTPDGKLYFATTEPVTIPAGQVETLATCICQTDGTIGNDYVAGQIAKLVDPFPYEMQAVNIDTSAGGSDIEDDEAFRERIHIAPESFSNAGTRNGYKYFALTADSDIIDVCVLTPETEKVEPGIIEIYPLMKGGTIPTSEVLETVRQICSADDISGDVLYIRVLPPVEVNYSVNLKYWIDSENAAQAETIKANVDMAVLEWAKWQSSKLGRDINPSRLIHDITAAGAKRCEIITPSFTHVEEHQVSRILPPLNVKFVDIEE